MSTKDSIPTGIRRTVALLVATVLVFSTFTLTAFATAAKTEVPGRIYEFGKDSHYEFSETKEYLETGSSNTYGTFSISGEVSDVTTKDGIPAYEVTEGNLKFFYNYGDTLLNADEDSWHLIEDKSKKLDDLKLSENILKGAIILQTSTDRLNWVDVVSLTDAFNKTPIRTEYIYETKDVQLINGCYYRLVVAYELRIRTEDSNILFINTDKFDYKKYAEVYEFYAYTDNGEANVVDPSNGYRLGNKVRVEEHDGYFGEKEIKKGDLHYGDKGAWDLGKFFVSGHTDEVIEANGNVVFLKNVGDKVTLWFNLEQNINALNGNENLSITPDENGYDQYFGTASMDFGRGALIIRKTDHNNVTEEPTIYTNYLEANTMVGADTIVRLCEEGDYEVALDYEVTSDELIDKTGHYRIFFKFSVRNSNCMVFPRDLATGGELTNSAMTEAGFWLDYANSHYLKVNVKREVLTDSADGLVEDTRFNRSAKDGAEFTDEGIYTITVKNAYNGESTEKRIYVGTNNVLRAYMNNPNLTISEINNLVANGATISEDGTIQLVSNTQTQPDIEDTIAPTTTPTVSTKDKNTPSENESSAGFPIPVAIGAIVVCIIVGINIFKKKSKKEPIVEKNNENNEGGTEE